MADDDFDVPEVLIQYVAVVSHPDTSNAALSTTAFNIEEATKRLEYLYDSKEGGLQVDDPICDVCIIKPSLGDKFPPEYELVTVDGRGMPANLSQATDKQGFQTPAYMGIKRSRTSPPLTFVMFVEAVDDMPLQPLPAGATLLTTTVGGRPAHVDLGLPGRCYLMCVKFGHGSPHTNASDGKDVDLDSERITLIYAAKSLPLPEKADGVIRGRIRSRLTSDGGTTGSDPDDDDNDDQNEPNDDPDERKDAVLQAARSRRSSISSIGSRHRPRSHSSESAKSSVSEPSAQIPVNSNETVVESDPNSNNKSAVPSPVKTEAMQPFDSSEVVVLVTPDQVPMRLFAMRYLPSRSWMFDSPPALLDRFPLTDRRDNELPLAIPIFCQPTGARYRFTPGTAKMLSFVLTNNLGNRVHAASLQFFERVDRTEAFKTVHPRVKKGQRRRQSISSLEPNTSSPPPSISFLDMSASETATGLSLDLQQSDGAVASYAPSAVSNDQVSMNTRELWEQSNLGTLGLSDSSTNVTTTPINEYEQIINKTVYVLKSVCILSEWPFYNSFFETLIYFVTLAATDLTIPLEKYIANLFEVPIPPPGSVRIEHRIGPNRVEYWRPELQSLPMPNFPSDMIFRYLCVKNVVQLLSLVMVEAKIIFHSQNECILNPVIESLTELLFPFKWPNIFIPVFPLALVDFLEAFVPYLFGMATSTFQTFMENENIPTDVCVVDLDNNRIRCSRPISMLPQHQRLVDRLGATLTNLRRQRQDVDNLDIQSLSEQSLTRSPITETPITDLLQIAEHSNDIQNEFLLFSFELLNNYMDHLKVPTGDIDSVMDTFDAASFCSSKSNNAKEFYQALFETQLFNKFLEDRTFNSSIDGRHVFFDAQLSAYQEIEKKINSDGPKPGTLASRARSRVLRTKRVYVVLTPDTSPISSDSPTVFQYERWPILDPKRIPMVRIPTPINVTTAPLPKRPTANVESEPNFDSLASSPANKQSSHKRKPNLRRISGISVKSVSKKQAAVNVCQEFLLSIYSVWFRVYASFASVSDRPAQSLRRALAVLWQLKEVEAVTPSFLVYQYLLEICGKRGLGKEARFIFLDMAASGIQADAITYGWHVQAVAAGGADPLIQQQKAKKQQPPSGSTLFDQPLDMSGLEMSIYCVCKKCRHALSEIEVMAGWNSEDDSQGTECPKCGKIVVAQLVIRRSQLEGMASAKSVDSLRFPDVQTKTHTREPSDVPIELKEHKRSGSTASNSSVSGTPSFNTNIMSPSQSVLQLDSNVQGSAKSQPWVFSHVAADYTANVPLLKPPLFFNEMENALLARKGRLWKSKEQFLREQPSLFWNFIWYCGSLAIPFETRALQKLSVIPEAAAFVAGIEAMDRKNAEQPSKRRGLLRYQSMKSKIDEKRPSVEALNAIGGSTGLRDRSLSNSSILLSSTTSTSPPSLPPTNGPVFFDFDSLSPTVTKYIIRVNGLKRSLQGWPRRQYQKQIRAHGDPRTDEEKDVNNLLDTIDQAIAEGAMLVALRLFLEARARFPQREPYLPFHDSCYTYMVISAYTSGMAAARKPISSGQVSSTTKPQFRKDFTTTGFFSTPPPAATPTPKPIKSSQSFSDEFELLEAYKTARQQLDQEQHDLLTNEDEQPPLLVIALRTVFRHLRL